MAGNTLTETFEGVPLAIVEVGGAKWVRGQDITRALGFADPVKAMEKIPTRNRSEFDASTTCMIDMPTAGGYQSVRLYNARGAALIAMKAQTPKGEDFRRWVLDVLEGTADAGPVEAATGIPAGIRHSLATMFMQRRGNPQLLRYREMGLGPAEIAKLLGVRPQSVNPRLRVAEYLGLAAPPPGLAAMRQRPNFIKLQEGRDRAKAAREQLALAAPAETPEEANRRRDAETARIERANARRENGNG